MHLQVYGNNYFKNYGLWNFSEITRGMTLHRINLGKMMKTLNKYFSETFRKKGMLDPYLRNIPLPLANMYADFINILQNRGE